MKNFEYKKSLGQNFLVDKQILDKIIKNIDLDKNNLIIEIGPGSGNLTKELVKLDSFVIAFEIDKRLESELSKIESNNFNLYFEDFLKADLKGILSKYKYDNLYVVANIPYYITTPIIQKIYDETEAKEFILMVQKEVGDRFMASPRTKEYNSLSVFLQYNYDITKVTNVSKNSFYPVPKVDSAVIKFVKKVDKICALSEDKFYKLVKDSFRFKRKNIKNNLKNYDLSKIEEILKKYNKDLTVRAEELSIEEFIEISNAI